jgi:mRNA-degrading endonuclease toxin of MazEF toxin-antitoxin module
LNTPLSGIGENERVDQELYAWFLIKEKMRDKKQYPFFHEREVWMASWGINVGHEQNGRGSQFLRPVLILKKLSPSLFWGIPLTSRNKKGSWYISIHHQGRKSMGIISQIKTIDSRRIKYHMGTISEEEHGKIIIAITSIFKK